MAKRNPTRTRGAAAAIVATNAPAAPVAPTPTINGRPYAAAPLMAALPLLGGGGFVAGPGQALPVVGQVAPAAPTAPNPNTANLPPAVANAVQAAQQAKAAGTLVAAQAGRNAVLPHAHTMLVLLPPKRRLTGQAHGGTAQCYQACSTLAQAGQLTVGNAQAACAALGNPAWVRYAFNRWLAVAQLGN